MSDPEKPPISAPGAGRRFYTAAQVEADPAQPGAFAVRLDGRDVRTPRKERLSVPTRALAEGIAAEWAAQGERIDPRTMPLTRLVNSIIDGVQVRGAEVRADLRNYAASDLLCYRADGPQGLVERQARAWDEIVSWAGAQIGARLYLCQGVMPVAQPEAALEAVSAALATLDAYRLAALHVMTTLTGSILLGLAVLKGRITAEDAWARAHVDEDWQMEQWGVDAEAAERRERRWREMQAAAHLLELLNQP
jgi:chaperone required for assembly of F1-ATPase